MEKLTPEEQTLYAKKIYQKGFNPQIITEIKEVLQKEYVLEIFYWGMNKSEAEHILKDKNFRLSTFTSSGGTINVNGGKREYKISLDGFKYQDKIGQINLRITLEFYKDELVRVLCFTSDDIYENLNDYIKVYENLKTKLTEEYNKPTIERMDWLKDRYKNKPEKWGLAVSKGDLNYFSRWDTPITTVVLNSMGREDKINFAISYTNKKHWEIRKDLMGIP